MFFEKDLHKLNFAGVGLALIIFGIVTCAIGLAAWFLSALGMGSISYPFMKAIGGAMIIGLGYVVLELELLRKK